MIFEIFPERDRVQFSMKVIRICANLDFDMALMENIDDSSSLVCKDIV